MAVDIAGLALDFIDNYGLYAIFVLLIMDGALMLPVFPGELVLVMAVAAYVDDVPSLIFLIVLTSVAGLLGSLLLYGITRGGGRRLVERFPRFFMMPRKRRERLERTFSRPIGQSLVFFLRLVPLTRVLVNIPAGLAKMPIVRFLVLSTLGLLAYHAGFLWFSYEVQREGSALASQKEELEAAYASPAMDFVEANAIITGAVVLVLGAVLSVRASVQMFRDPEESGGSLVGWLATVVLFWGGLALAVATYLQPSSVVVLAEIGGVDVEALAAQMDLTTLEALFGTAGIMVFVGLVLRRMNGAALARRRRHVAEKKALERMRSDAALVAALQGGPADEPTAPAAHASTVIESDAFHVSSRTTPWVDREAFVERKEGAPAAQDTGSGMDAAEEAPDADSREEADHAYRQRGDGPQAGLVEGQRVEAVQDDGAPPNADEGQGDRAPEGDPEARAEGSSVGDPEMQDDGQGPGEDHKRARGRAGRAQADGAAHDEAAGRPGADLEDTGGPDDGDDTGEPDDVGDEASR